MNILDARLTVFSVIHGADDTVTGGLAKVARKLGLASNNLDSTVNDATIESDRHMTGRDGEQKTGFASSVVPTLEEQTVAEHRPEKTQGSDKPILDDLGSQGGPAAARPGPEGPSQARLHDGSNQLFGAPADAARSPATDDRPPHASGEKNDADEEEAAAIPARNVLRQHLSAKVGAKPWTLPAPTPAVDPHGFEDPVSDNFFKDVWVAAATHNVCSLYRFVGRITDLKERHPDGNIP